MNYHLLIWWFVTLIQPVRSITQVLHFNIYTLLYSSDRGGWDMLREIIDFNRRQGHFAERKETLQGQIATKCMIQFRGISSCGNDWFVFWPWHEAASWILPTAVNVDSQKDEHDHKEKAALYCKLSDKSKTSWIWIWFPFLLPSPCSLLSSPPHLLTQSLRSSTFSSGFEEITSLPRFGLNARKLP